MLRVRGLVFEEKDDANGIELLDGFGGEVDQFFELDVLDAERFDEEGEDARVTLYLEEGAR